jgi:hypothetical protein
MIILAQVTQTGKACLFETTARLTFGEAIGAAFQLGGVDDLLALSGTIARFRARRVRWRSSTRRHRRLHTWSTSWRCCCLRIKGECQDSGGKRTNQERRGNAASCGQGHLHASRSFFYAWRDQSLARQAQNGDATLSLPNHDHLRIQRDVGLI